MFTGIIETQATLLRRESVGTDLHLHFTCPITPQLHIDQSVAHNGVCLTVVAIHGTEYQVTAVAETLKKTNLGHLQHADVVNIERALRLGDRLDGHFVQGHVDGTGLCTAVETHDNARLYHFTFPSQFAALVIEKGSICINGVSLTIFNVGANSFTVTIIPYTYEHTNFASLQTGAQVNLEFDVLGKYFLRWKEVQVGA